MVAFSPMEALETRCKSPFCIVSEEGIRGRMFVPPKDGKGVAEIYCPVCLNIAKQMTFFSGQTAQMIRNVYKSYIDTELPKEVKLILEQFARELVELLGEEL